MWVATSLHPVRRQELPKLITANPTSVSFQLVNINVYTGLTRLCTGYAASIFLLVGPGVLIPRFALSGGEPKV